MNKPKRPIAPRVLGIDTRVSHLRRVVEKGRYKDFDIPEDIAMDILCDYAEYGHKVLKYFREYDKWVAQQGNVQELKMKDS